MLCANPQCRRDAQYFRDGSLVLVEFESGPNHRFEHEDEGFPTRSSPRKFFWLCADCASQFLLKSWTRFGVVLEPIKQAGVVADAVRPLRSSAVSQHLDVRSFASDL